MPLLREVAPGQFAACHFAEQLTLKGASTLSPPARADRRLTRTARGAPRFAPTLTYLKSERTCTMTANPWRRADRPLAISHRGHSIALPREHPRRLREGRSSWAAR